MRPGPEVTAISSMSLHPARTSANARLTSGKRCCRCSRDAISGTTPPNGWCLSICEAIRFTRTVPSRSSSATEVSSHEVSMPRIITNGEQETTNYNPRSNMHEELAKRYEPASFEQRWYEFWERGGFFTPLVDRERPKFSIVIPPPNVTGRLHIGHALVNTLQDIVVRWKRMSGFNTLWLPGTDHAGIGTQMVVDRELTKQGISRFDIGREKFVERVWEWKESYGHQIIDQLKRLGSSADWTRSRFTLDEGLSRAVRYVFVKLYEDGLIYRDLAMVNWCPFCRTAISDIEVEYRELNGKIYQIDYLLADGDRKLTVATTRPETMLGDTALAVHPGDERYKDLIGREAILPIAERRIPIIADSILVDPEFGTGVVKVTPVHDKNDYEAGKRNNLPELQVIDETGRMTEIAGPEFAGRDRFEARLKVLEKLRESGLLRDTKDY